jgi:hypothetical protein
VRRTGGWEVGRLGGLGVWRQQGAQGVGSGQSDEPRQKEADHRLAARQPVDRANTGDGAADHAHLGDWQSSRGQRIMGGNRSVARQPWRGGGIKGCSAARSRSKGTWGASDAMTVILELSPDQEARLHEEAARSGLPVAEYALTCLFGRQERNPLGPAAPSHPARAVTARDLLAMAPAERSAYLRWAAEDAAPLYESDLALPPAERELTALTALDGEPFDDHN